MASARDKYKAYKSEKFTLKDIGAVSSRQKKFCTRLHIEHAA
jgi:hypothetical protein